MSGRKRFSVLRDPVHGDIDLTDEELAVLDTREMQRLRGVKQLGTAYLAYPGAVHSRFEHSIGTLHVTRSMIEAINQNADLEPRACLGISEEEARLIRLAALIHDVTHVPFGHNIEDQSGLLERHDSAARYRGMLSVSTELGRLLDELGVRDDVLTILLPQGTEGRAPIPPYWSQIMSDTICSDILDYLARDAYFTGLRLQVDERIVRYFKVDRASGNLYLDLQKRELLREDILSEIVRILEARYYFSERVYYHHAKVSAGALIARAAELCLGAGLIEDADLYMQTDHSLVDLLRRSVHQGDPRLRARVSHLLEGFERRRLFKRACVFPRYENEQTQKELVERYFARGRGAERAAVEARIADLVRFATGKEIEVIVYCPAARMQLKEVATHVRWPGVHEPRPLAEFSDRVPRLADLERSYRDLWKFYVLADARDPAVLAKVQEVAIGEFPGAVNAYRL
ncbi:HD domain-containing protein [Engelhardtia mirabilis]|uniref:HD domain protein n=1 Tax=Engelhardtia mirabilis TaxID=2528011 RepID=A0A518BNY9_9BACT|nr:HD domain protein [Planctomycetes bacterium Pla133]QDV03014.1 HD domain protein [Planctomycetes bacterium Pla86]